ncbi:DUF3168 domain-containing protein [Croceicoccus estronivorus]|uniref:DUF3168 domain-containing protein n=1 Tax=Croceicoccus estronivorus TaxID=1172626 RepID=UPI00082CE1BA|nr:DUF3168 domain-containing protein [Croceicoccus estronivorus]OCC24246.1 DUF3168 domain-containing protein [Croceicoccus estronivorus]
METALRAALIRWLASDPALAAINVVAEESPIRAPVPWLGIAASTSTDWSTKDRIGREIRVALELHTRGDDPASAASLVRTLEGRIASLPAAQPEFTVVTAQFLRARAEQRPRNTRAMLVEYRFRVLAN